MRGIGKRFGATVALEGVELEARRGEVLALVGENGAGKSTLMKVLSGALACDRGEMQLDGEPYAPRSPVEARRAGVAMIYQELALAPHLSVAENVVLGAEPARGGMLDWSELRRRARAALQRVGRGELDLEQRVGALRVADRQLVEIARSLALEAKVLVLDEPTSSLGRKDTRRLFELVRELRGGGATIVYISHVLEELFEIADRITVLRDGRTIESMQVRDATPAHVVAAMVGRDVGELYPRSPARPGEVLARIDGLAGRKLPREATLELRRGEVLGIAGLVGAGRTELLRAVFGLDEVASGRLRVLALEGPRTPGERWRQGVGFASEDRKLEGLALARPIAENLCLPRLDKLARRGWLSPRAMESSARGWIERLGVRCAGPQQPIGALSGGNQQKVALARLFFADADVFLLDEPTRGVDVGAKAEIYGWIDSVARVQEPRKAVLFVSSYLPELFGVCDRIAVMSRGVLHPARAADEIDEHEVMLQAAGGAA
jgi:ribose transport system ATP-binding protein